MEKYQDLKRRLKESPKMDDLYTKLKKNLVFHIVVEGLVQETQYGNITFNVRIKDGVVSLEHKDLNIVKNKRRRYGLT